MNRWSRGPVLVLLVAWVAACAGPSGSVAGSPAPAEVTFPASTLGTPRPVGPAVARTRAELVRSLGAYGLVLTDTQAPFRPPESARMAATPRAVYQVQLPRDPDQGFLVVYDFADPSAAAEAAASQATYLASGPARVQTSLGTRHLIRVVGSTVVLYSWDPGGLDDPAAPDVPAALQTIGSGVDVPS